MLMTSGNFTSFKQIIRDSARQSVITYFKPLYYILPLIRKFRRTLKQFFGVKSLHLSYGTHADAVAEAEIFFADLDSGALLSFDQLVVKFRDDSDQFQIVVIKLDVAHLDYLYKHIEILRRPHEIIKLLKILGPFPSWECPRTTEVIEFLRKVPIKVAE